MFRSPLSVIRELTARRAAARREHQRLVEEHDLCDGGTCDFLGGLCSRHMRIETDAAQRLMTDRPA